MGATHWATLNGSDHHGPFDLAGIPPSAFGWSIPDACLVYHIHGLFDGHEDDVSLDPCGHGGIVYFTPVLGAGPTSSPGGSVIEEAIPKVDVSITISGPTSSANGFVNYTVVVTNAPTPTSNATTDVKVEVTVHTALEGLDLSGSSDLFSHRP